MTRHEKAHIEAGDTQDAVRVANRAEREEMYQTEVQENYPAYMSTDGEIYVCNADDLKDLPKDVPPGTLPGQRDAEDMPHSYVPTKTNGKKRTVTIDDRIDSSSSHHGARSKHETVPVVSVPDLFHMSPGLDQKRHQRSEQLSREKKMVEDHAAEERKKMVEDHAAELTAQREKAAAELARHLAETARLAAQALAIRTPLYSHLGNESVRKIDFYGLAIALTKS